MLVIDIKDGDIVLDSEIISDSRNEDVVMKIMIGEKHVICSLDILTPNEITNDEDRDMSYNIYNIVGGKIEDVSILLDILDKYGDDVRVAHICGIDRLKTYIPESSLERFETIIIKYMETDEEYYK